MTPEVLEAAAVSASEGEAPAIRELDDFLTRLGSVENAAIIVSGETAEIPPSVYSLLKRLVHELARGRAVTVMPTHAELTTQEAADILNVSRPFLVKLLEAGEIPFHLVGTHRRIRFEDVLEYRRRRHNERLAALADMAQEAQEMGLYE